MKEVMRMKLIKVPELHELGHYKSDAYHVAVSSSDKTKSIGNVMELTFVKNPISSIHSSTNGN